MLKITVILLLALSIAVVHVCCAPQKPDDVEVSRDQTSNGADDEVAVDYK
jgi:hypothetical protein